MKEDSHPPTDGVQAVVLTLRILEYLANQGRAVGVTALAQALDTTKSRIYRHLQTLVQYGYAAQSNDSERYKIGARLLTLGHAASENFDLLGAARDVLQDLRDTLGHPTVISIPDVEGVRVVGSFAGKMSIEINVKQGSVLPWHSTSQGKIALAFGPKELREAVLRSRLPLITPHTIVSPVALERELARILAQGWAVSANEGLIGINALAAPVFDSVGSLVATISIVDSVQFIEQEPTEDQIRCTVDAARRISKRLGDLGDRG